MLRRIFVVVPLLAAVPLLATGCSGSKDTGDSQPKVSDASPKDGVPSQLPPPNAGGGGPAQGKPSPE